jgi:N-acetylmuramoyl-L-alanine amidase
MRRMTPITLTEGTACRKTCGGGRCVKVARDPGEHVRGLERVGWRAGTLRRGALCAAIASLAFASRGAAAPEAKTSERFDTVVIDAGHGGSDMGARGPSGALEKDVALAIARNLAQRLRARGLTVVMTRDADVRVPLEQRTAIANDARGDLFVSIHANASQDERIHGSETFFLALDASDASAAHVAERENGAFAEESKGEIGALNDPFIGLLGDLISTEHLDESSAFAQSVQHELGTLPLRSRGVKQAMFVVLSGVQMPAALVEVGFVTHRGDESAINGTAGRKAIVEALERAVSAFGERYDARRGVGSAGPASR